MTSVTDWHSLRDAYGPADEVPALLARMSTDETDPVWNDLWSRLCHQGSVYPASFAALPLLEAAAQRWSASDRVPALDLAGAIVASQDRVGVNGDPLADVRETVLRLHALALESLATRDRSPTSFIYLLEAARSLGGDSLWATRLDRITDGEIEGVCPHCDADLYVAIGQYGCFVTTEDWVKQPDVRREPITPEHAALPDPGEWMRERALAADQSQVAGWIECLFGTSRCPSCERTFAVAEAVELAEA